MKKAVEFEAECSDDIPKPSGSRITDFMDSYVVIDIETTGLDCKNDKIIELAAVKVTGDSVEEFQSFVNPECKISKTITKITGIDNEMVKDAPTIENVINEFIYFIGDSIILGHNVTFDIGFINNSLYKCNNKTFDNNYIDTLVLSRKYINHSENHKLDTLKSKFNIDTGDSHRALIDCYTAHELYRIIYDNYNVVKPSTKKDKPKISQEQFLSYKFAVKAKNITTTNTEFDESSIVYQKYFVFTGSFEKFNLKEAMQKIVDNGGICWDNVTKKCNYLILGDNDGRVSGKQKKAIEYNEKGQGIQIISEDEFVGSVLSAL